jgi:hypothetical protein
MCGCHDGCSRKGKTVILFGSKLAVIESRLIENIQKTKEVFPEEIQRIEFGLALMRDVTQVTQYAVKDYGTKPDLVTNHNLFARNRQLLLNAYICSLSSSYGTQFVILRVVLENNFLMRLFRKNPQSAFEWLSKERQKRFTTETQMKYGKSGRSNKRFRVDLSKRIFRDLVEKNARRDITTMYKELSNYTHPNFRGWQELMGQSGKAEVIYNMPKFYSPNAEQSMGAMLYAMGLSFKEFVESFRNYLHPFADQLKEWRDGYNKLILRHIESNSKK